MWITTPSNAKVSPLEKVNLLGVPAIFELHSQSQTTWQSFSGCKGSLGKVQNQQGGSGKWRFPKMGVPLSPKSSILMGFCIIIIINHSFGGTPIYGNPQMFLSHLECAEGTCFPDPCWRPSSHWHFGPSAEISAADSKDRSMWTIWVKIG